MSTLLMATLAMMAGPPDAAVGTEVAPKSAHHLRAEIRDALVREARANNASERADAVRHLAALFGEVRHSTALAKSERVRLTAKLRYRLSKIGRDLGRQVARKEKSAVRSARAKGASGGGPVDDPGEAMVGLIQKTVRPDTWQVNGGRGVIVKRGGVVPMGQGGAFGGGGAVGDSAEALIELIQKTVRPESWDINGGKGVIMYWRG